ncbi:MAG: hypothetical protein IJN89_07815 [Anaerotignum sp.]|nr:hypothetical protein [Anaerotignum sp.]
MNPITILVFALVLALIMLTAFSLLIISTALNKKNIKLDLFAFDFNFGKLKRGGSVIQKLNLQVSQLSRKASLLGKGIMNLLLPLLILFLRKQLTQQNIRVQILLI